MDYDMKFGILHPDFLSALRYKTIERYKRRYSNSKGINNQKNFTNNYMKQYKHGRPYLFIETDRYDYRTPDNHKLYIAFPVYSGEKDDLNSIVQHKIDPKIQKIFYFFKNHGMQENEVKGEPYISFRSPLLVDEQFIEEIKPEYLKDINLLVGKGTKTEITEKCCRFISENKESIISSYEYFMEHHNEIINGIYHIKSQKGTNISYDQFDIETKKYLSKQILNDNPLNVFSVNHKAKSFSRTNMRAFEKQVNETESRREYSESVKKTALSEDRIQKNYLQDHIRRKTPYINFKGVLQKIQGESEASVLQHGYENENQFSSQKVLEIMSDRQQIAEHLRRNSGMILKGVKPSNRNEIVYFCYQDKPHPYKNDVPYAMKVTDMISALSQNNSSIRYDSSSTESRIIGYAETDKIFDSSVQVNCVISDNADPQVALDLIITNYICNNIRDEKGKFKYKFGGIFYYGTALAEFEMISLEVKRKLSEMTGIPFNADRNFNALQDNGTQLITNRKIIGDMMRDADKIVQDILHDSRLSKNKTERKNDMNSIDMNTV